MSDTKGGDQVCTRIKTNIMYICSNELHVSDTKGGDQVCTRIKTNIMYICSNELHVFDLKESDLKKCDPKEGDSVYIHAQYIHYSMYMQQKAPCV